MGSVPEDEQVLSFEPALDFLYAIDPDDRRAVDPDEALRVQLLFDLREALVDLEHLAARVNPDVLPLRFDPVDLRGLQKGGSSFSPDREPGAVSAPAV